MKERAQTGVVHHFNSHQPDPDQSCKSSPNKPFESQISSLTNGNRIRRYVHNYHDHSRDIPDAKDLSDTTSGASCPFPLKLHRLLEEAESNDQADVLSWQPHGRSFWVHKPEEFVTVIMPKYFRHTKFSSFQRQLNIYGFSRITKGRDKGGYYHELFLRGKEFLCRKMNRISVKGTGVRTPSNPDNEPNLYAMMPVLKTEKRDIQKKVNQLKNTKNVREKRKVSEVHVRTSTEGEVSKFIAKDIATVPALLTSEALETAQENERKRRRSNTTSEKGIEKEANRQEENPVDSLHIPAENEMISKHSFMSSNKEDAETRPSLSDEASVDDFLDGLLDDLPSIRDFSLDFDGFQILKFILGS